MTLDYETALIVAAVQNDDVFFHARSLRLTKDAFTLPECASIWQSLCLNADEGQPHTPVELWMRLRHEAGSEGADAAESFYHEARKDVTDYTAHEKWAQHVAEGWIARRKKKAMETAWEMAHNGESINDVASFLSKEITEAEDTVALEEDRLRRQREAVTERIRARITGTGDVVRTGITLIDRHFGNLQSHEFIVAAARPGCGKSSLARQIMMEHVRASKNPVMLFSLEMGTDQVIQAMASQNCGVSSWRIEEDFDDRRDKLIAETERMASALGKYFYIYDDVYKIGDIEHHIHMAARRHRPSFIAIDYLQLIEPPAGRGMNREQQVAYISRRLKQLAQMHRIPILCLCQMGRDYEKENRKPRLSDLRESGSLEQDADRVWFLHSEKDAVAVDGIHPVQLIQEKCRGGSQYSLDIGFQKSITKFIF